MSDDPETPNALLEDFQSYLLLLARAQTAHAGSPIDPRDAVQQTLATAQEKLHQYRGRTTSEFAGWLRTILANHLRDLWRRKGRELDEQALAGQLAESSARLAKIVAAEQSSPSQQLAKSERLHRLADALMSLPEDQRRAIELRHLRGLSMAEIAEQMQRSSPSVGGLLQRGLKTLRQTMNE